MTEADDLAVSQVVTACYHFVAKPDRLTEEELEGGIREYCTPHYMSISRAKDIAFVAEFDGTVVGFAATRDISIQQMFVDPDHHREGVGGALFRKAQDTVAKPGHSVLKVKTTRSALPFYTAMGMRQTGTYVIRGAGPWAGRELIVLEKGIQP